MWLLLVLLVPARADIPLPSYRDELVRAAWEEVDDLIARGEHDAAVASAQAFQRHVTPDATLEYLIGYSWRLRTDFKQAESHYHRALEMDPSLDEAWNDLGEMMLSQGRMEESQAAFEQLSRLLTTGPNAWLGPWRLAELAAHRHDPEGFEENMRVALERGFSFRLIEGLPNWQAFYRDPAMRDSVEKLITVYGERSTLDSLR
jgi:tetratricopeptide (TPR) repeat protein